MRLLYVATKAGTLGQFLSPISLHFRAQGWRVDGMAQGISTSSRCIESFDRVWEMRWSRNPLDPQNLLVAPRQVRAIVESEGYDLVHVHTPVAAFATRLALRGLRRKGKPKVIYTAHGFHFYPGGPPLQNTLYLGLEKLAGHWTDHLIVMNDEDYHAIQAHDIVPPDRAHYMPGIGIDTRSYSPESVSAAKVLEIRREIGLQPEDSSILMVAEFIPRKLHCDALRAFARLSRPNAHLVFAGEGVLLEEMQALAEELGVRPTTHFLGHRRDIPALMRASVAVLLPSRQEGLSRSVMESLSLEVPVIGTDIRGIKSLVQDGCGLVVQVGDVEGLADAMAWMLDHPREALEMGRRGRERMSAYDLRQILALHESLYESAIEARDPA
jgi:glycosyltransferase involved in cell wall biosynthesis